MSSSLPLLKVVGPDGQRFDVELRQDRVTIGRGKELNDIDLDGPSYMMVSRRSPCIVERSEKAWWVNDNNSRNFIYILEFRAEAAGRR